MPNMKKKISMQNKKIRSEAAILRKEELTRFMQQLPQPRPPRGRPPSKNPNCNCENGFETCELNGKCLKKKDIIYNAKVKGLIILMLRNILELMKDPLKPEFMATELMCV